MSEREMYTVAEQQRRKKRKSITVVFCCFAVVITFLLGMIVGAAFSSDSVYPSGTSEAFATLESVYNIMAEKFYYGENTEEYREKLIEDAIKGMVNAQGDIHTEYMTPDELSSFTGSLESSFVGIGVRYTNLSGKIFILDVIKSSPAEKSGILPGDFLVSVDGKPITEENADKVSEMVGGKEGTDVVVGILRDNKVIEFTVTRGTIDSTVFSKIVDGVGVLTVTSFGTGTGKELKNHLEYFRNEGVKRLIIDLRENGGGYASTLDTMCSYFMNNNEIVMIEEYRDGRQLIDRVKDSDRYEYDKIVILIDGNSASCSEVFTMALKENCGAVTVGETSYGKGIAQIPKSFPDGSALKYTDVIWKSGNGVSIHGTGITPDYPVRLHDALYLPYLTIGEDETYGTDSVSYACQYVQIMLDFVGENVDRTDGYYSAATESAVRHYQQVSGFAVTGIIDNELITNLTSDVVMKWNLEKDTYDFQMQKALEVVKN